MKDRTFEYLCNAFEYAAQSGHPVKLDYALKRKAVFSHVEKLESDQAALIDALRNLTAAISDNFCSLCGKTKAEGGHSKFCPMVEAEAVLKDHQ